VRWVGALVFERVGGGTLRGESAVRVDEWLVWGSEWVEIQMCAWAVAVASSCRKGAGFEEDGDCLCGCRDREVETG